MHNLSTNFAQLCTHFATKYYSNCTDLSAPYYSNYECVQILSYFVRTLLQKSCSNCTDLSAPPVRTKYFHALYALCYKSPVAIIPSFPHSTTQITYAYKILSQIVCDPKYKNVELIRRTCCAKCGSSDVTARVASINEVSVVTVQSPSMVAEKTVRGLKRRVY